MLIFVLCDMIGVVRNINKSNLILPVNSQSVITSVVQRVSRDS